MRHPAEAERDAAAVQPDDDRDALAGHVRCCRLEGCVRSHEIDDRGEQTLRLSGGHRVVSAELECDASLVGGGIDDDDLGIGAKLDELQPVLPQAAGAEHERPWLLG